MTVNEKHISGPLGGSLLVTQIFIQNFIVAEKISATTTEIKIILFPQFVIVVIDSTDRERLAVTREELYRMLAHEELSKAAVLIYANKQDLKGSMSAAEISKQLDLTSIKKHQWQIQSCCALTGEG
jgi:signal recognition particle receptor subunit beta